MTEGNARLQNGFALSMPKRRTSCAVFSSPHSGTQYPADFLRETRLDRNEIRSSEDAFVDQLFAAAPDHGAPFLSATYPRAYVDLNRASDEIDPALVEGASKKANNPRIMAGLGVIPRVVAEGKPIRDGKISLAEAQRRLTEAYHPYHQCLQMLIDEQRQRFGMAILFDCHSMPHDALTSAPLVRGARPNIIVGDRFGAAAPRWLTDTTSDILTRLGFTVVRNAPFAGGYITRHYGRPSQNVFALQIEIDRALYMDERSITMRPEFEDVMMRLTTAISHLAMIGGAGSALAAE